MKKGTLPEPQHKDSLIDMSSSLFSMAITKPFDTPTTKYITLGKFITKKGYERFCKKFEVFVNSLQLDEKFFFNKPLYTWLIVEVSQIDGQDYAELSLSEAVYLPIAGRQLSCIEMEASKLEMSIAGFADSLNFMLNDNRE